MSAPTGPRVPLAWEMWLTLLIVVVVLAWCVLAAIGGTA